MQSAAAELRGRVEHTILAQGDSEAALLSRFTEEHATCLFATMGFWQGIDVPGPSLSLVTIDRLPSPVPTTRCCRPAASAPGPTRSARSTCLGRGVLAQATGR